MPATNNRLERNLNNGRMRRKIVSRASIIERLNGERVTAIAQSGNCHTAPVGGCRCCEPRGAATHTCPRRKCWGRPLSPKGPCGLGEQSPPKTEIASPPFDKLRTARNDTSPTLGKPSSCSSIQVEKEQAWQSS